MPGMAFGLYFASINLKKNDFRSLVGFSGILMISIRLFLLSFIFTNYYIIDNYGNGLTIYLILAIFLTTVIAFYIGNTFFYP